MLESAIKLVGVAVLIVGVLTLAAPWLRGADRRYLPPPGWVCWSVATSGGTHHACEPARGWHLEEWPGVGQVSVPDDAGPVRRHYLIRE